MRTVIMLPVLVILLHVEVPLTEIDAENIDLLW